MDPLAAILVLVALVVVATIIGLIWKHRIGRVRTGAHTEIVTPADVRTDAAFGERATLLQFSTEFCAYCPATHRLLGGIAERTDGVAHIDVDLTESPDLAQRFHVLQTPTTLLLDGRGTVHGRIGGPPKRAELEESLATILNGADRVEI